MKTYRVEVKRESDWWIISVPELDGITSEAKTHTDIEFIARDLIAIWIDEKDDSFNVEILESAS